MFDPECLTALARDATGRLPVRPLFSSLLFGFNPTMY